VRPVKTALRALRFVLMPPCAALCLFKLRQARFYSVSRWAQAYKLETMRFSAIHPIFISAYRQAQHTRLAQAYFWLMRYQCRHQYRNLLQRYFLHSAVYY
jgi:hypothetical protein